VRNIVKTETRVPHSSSLFKKLDLLTVTVLFSKCFVYV